MISYAKLWILLENRGMKKTDLKQIMSGNTLAKLGKNEIISSAVIEKICAFLNCQPGDIMEYISEETLTKMATQIDNVAKMMIEALEKQGISKEQFGEMIIQELPNYLKEVSEGTTPTKNKLEKEFIEMNKDNEQ